MMAELMVLSKISMVLTAHGSNRIVYVTDDHVDISTSNRDTGRSAVELSLYRLLNSRVFFLIQQFRHSHRTRRFHMISNQVL